MQPCVGDPVSPYPQLEAVTPRRRPFTLERLRCHCWCPLALGPERPIRREFRVPRRRARRVPSSHHRRLVSSGLLVGETIPWAIRTRHRRQLFTCERAPPYLRVPQAQFGPIVVPDGPPDERFLLLSDARTHLPVSDTRWPAPDGARRPFKASAERGDVDHGPLQALHQQRCALVHRRSDDPEVGHVIDQLATEP